MTGGNHSPGYHGGPTVHRLTSSNLLIYQSVAANYSAGSTPFGEIARLGTPAYNRPTLVDDSPSGSG